MVTQDVEDETVKMTPQQLKAIEDDCFTRGLVTGMLIAFGGMVAVFLVYKVGRLLSGFVLRTRVEVVEPVAVQVVSEERPAVTAAVPEAEPVVVAQVKETPSEAMKQPEIKDYVPERMVAGSTFTPGKLQPFMFWVDVYEDSAWYQKGLGFRVAEGCFTALHVVYGGEKLRFRNVDFSKEVSFDQGKLIEGDAMLFPEECAPMGTTRATLSRIPIIDFQQMVQITNGTQMSVGPLQDSQLFGTVYYRGSTVGGFSGAPYFSGKTIYGMHTGSEAFNCGYEAAYLRALLKRNEDSDEYFLSKLKLGHRFRHRISPYDPSEVMIKTKNGYYTMDWNEYQRAADLEDMGTTQDEKMDDMPMPAYYTKSERRALANYRKANSGRDSGKVFLPENCQGPAVAVSASAGPIQTSPLGVQSPSSPICPEIPSKSLKASPPSKDMDPPRLMHAPKSVVSASTSESMQQELEELRKLVSKSTSLCDRLHGKLTKPSSVPPAKSRSTNAS